MVFFDDSEVAVWEEDGLTFRKICDFKNDILKEDGVNYAGRWSGFDMGGSGSLGKIVCDPVREQVYYRNSAVFDLRTGKPLGCVNLPGCVDDIAFDKKGYLHNHWNPGFSSFGPGVSRHDPGQRKPAGRSNNFMPENTEFFSYAEVPYDYGVEPRKGEKPPLGVLPVRDQEGAKFFQDGLGVNMRGDVAVESIIYYAPKFEDDSAAYARSGAKSDGYHGAPGDVEGDRAAAFAKDIQLRMKRGEEVYSIKAKPGSSLMGGTIWTFNSSGELRSECAVTVGRLINGIMMDEDGDLYFAVDCQRLIGGKPFLTDRGSVLGKDGKTRKATTPFVGTLIKTRGSGAQLLQKHTPIEMDVLPDRAPELRADGEDAWMDGAEWFYAGASPIVPGGCSCRTQRLHLDWFKRVYVPEAYRHSIAVLDTNGNLILHVGQYGNIDSADGAKSKIPVGGDGIGMTMVRMISGTDNYLCFSDNGERITVLKLNYHAEETAGISNQ
jgi:hypothetical protein